MPDPQSTATVPTAPPTSPANAALTSAFVFRKQELEKHKDFVLTFVDRSDRKRAPFVDIWDELFENYLVVPSGELTRRRLVGMDLRSSTSMWRDPAPLADRSRLKDPTTHALVETLAAQAIGLLFSSRDYIQAIPVGADDPEKARLISRLLMAVLEQPGFFRTNYQLFKDAFIFGTAIIEMGWETRSRMQWVPRPVLDSLGRLTGARELVPGEVIYRDRPLPRQIDHYNFYPDPSGTRIQEDMVGCAKRFVITAQEARRLAEAGTYTEKDAVERAINNAAMLYGVRAGRSGTDAKFAELANLLPTEFGLMTGFEYWGEYPGRTSDGFTNRVITVLNGEVVRSYGNPRTSGTLPFKEIVVNPIQGRFWGLSPAEVVRYLQDSTDHYMMTLQDAANAAVRGPLMIGRGWGGNPEELRQSRVNAIIECADPTKAGIVPRDHTALSFALQELARRQATMKDASGASGQMLPMPTGDRASATEVSEVVRLASQRGEMMITLIEKDDYPHIGREIHSLLRQFTGPDDEILAVWAGERFNITLDDIDIDADIRFVGSRQATSKFQKVAALKDAIATLSTNPEIMSILPDLVVRYMRDGLDIPDADEIIARAMQTLAAQQAQLSAQGRPVTPGRPVPGSGKESQFGTQAGQTEKQGQKIA